MVDPQTETRTLYSAAFRSQQWHVDEADDGRVALAIALAATPDVVITAARLPGISGYDLCRELRRDALTSHVPVVLVTRDSGSGTLSAAQACGADRILSEPFAPERLFSELDRMRIGRTARDILGSGMAHAASLQPRPARAAAPDAPSRRTTLVRSHQRATTTEPPVAPPPLVCPVCDTRLTYDRSHVGGVSALHPEQWDDYTCGGCGSRYQYRQRTRKLRRL